MGIKMLQKLRSFFIKTKVLEEKNLNNITYRVVEKSSIIPSYSNRRAIVFRVDGSTKTYIHSMIYLDKKNRYQPTFYLPQRVLDLWNEDFSLSENLCLGAAGCAVPRFLGLNFKESHTVGVEYSKEFIEFAKKYFLLNEIENQFDLVNDDAFEYVKNEEIKGKFDSVYIDIFDSNKVPDEVFSMEFTSNLYNITKENSVLVFNFITEEPQKVEAFANSLKEKYTAKLILQKNLRTVLVLVKSDDEEKAKRFIQKLNHEGSIITV